MTFSRAIAMFAGLVAMVVASSGVSSVGATPTSQQTVTVDMAGTGPGGPFVFAPAEITVAPGTTVNWVTTSGSHTTTHDTGLWDTGRRLAEGESFAFTFTRPGTYVYYCEPHRNAGMVGVVRVTTAGKAMGPAVPAPDLLAESIDARG
jgi:plastocyanin